MVMRREGVILELHDQFSGPVTRATLATRTFRQELDRLDRTSVRSSRNTDRHAAANNDLADSYESILRQLDGLHQRNQSLNNGIFGNQHRNQIARNSAELDRYSGRLRLIRDLIITLGPGLIPIGGVSIAGLAGIANQAGIAAAAVGTAVVAFQGMGDATEALNEYGLEPTADNLEKVHETFSRLSPEAQAAATRVSFLRTQFRGLRDAAAAGLFPWLTNADIDPLLGRLESVLSAVANATGAELADGLESLGSDRWSGFFDFVAREAAPTMADLARIIGNSGHALAGMWQAFQPLNRDFGDWLVDVTDDWDEWADRLDESEGFQEFVDYVRDNGPRVADTLGALGGAMVDIVVAAAPLGGPVLTALEAVADVISAIAESDFGTPVLAGLAALTLFNRTAQALTFTLGRVTGAQGFAALPAAISRTNTGVRSMASNVGVLATGWLTAGAVSQRQADRMAAASTQLRSSFRSLAAPAAIIGGLGIAASGAADGIGLTNTISLALMGTMAGPWGAAVGGAVGLMMDLSAASDRAAEAQKALEDSMLSVGETLDPVTGGATAQTRALLEQALAAQDVDDRLQNLGFSMDDVLDSLTGVTPENFIGIYDGLRNAGGEGEELARILMTLADELNEASNEHQSLTEATGQTAQAFDDAAAAIDRMATAYAAWSETLTAFDATTALGEALTALDEFEGRVTTDWLTADGQAFRGLLSGWSESLRGVLDTADLADRPAILEQAIRQLAATMGVSIDTAWDWANQVGVSSETVNASLAGVAGEALMLKGSLDSLPSELRAHLQLVGFPQTEAEVDTLLAKYPGLEGERETLLELQSRAASLGITNYIDLLNAIPRQQTTTVTTRYRTEGRPAPQVNAPLAKADGGYIAGPGGPRDDLIPAMLSNGEFVVNAAATSRHLELLHQINAQRYSTGGYVRPHDHKRQGPQYFADGGQVFAQQQAAQQYSRYERATSDSAVTDAAIRAAQDAAASAAAAAELMRRMDRRLAELPARVGAAVQKGAKEGSEGRDASVSGQRRTGGPR